MVAIGKLSFIIFETDFKHMLDGTEGIDRARLEILPNGP